MLTEQDLRVGNLLEYYIGEEGLEWEPTKIDWQDIKEVSENPEKFNKRHRPIALTEEVLRKIEGVECNYKSLIHSKYSIKNGMSFVVWYNNSYLQFYGKNIKIKYLHQLQQLSRFLGHELVINF